MRHDFRVSTGVLTKKPVLSGYNIMLKIKGYDIHEQLYKGKHSTIFRGMRSRDLQPVIIKIHSSEFPTDIDINKFKREYKIGKAFHDSHIVQYLDIEPYKHGLALILEDFGSVGLSSIIPGCGFGVAEFLEIAIQLADGVDAIHRENIIHRVINPHHIVINPATLHTKFIDFGVSSPLNNEIQSVVGPKRLEADLSYISPEQTGRMNRSMDYRTDFYSLGVTFYQLATGRLPFSDKNALTLIHAHIAKIPVPPGKVNTQIPDAISNIIMKMMEKNAENRYQTAYGLKLDLVDCKNQLEKSGEVINFPAGMHDLSDKFGIHQKLYGRDNEIKQLIDVFDLVSSGKKSSTLMLVYGYSGIGKSSLINEVHKSLVREGGYFISGKYDQFKRNIPYSSFIQAFQGLIRQLLAESDSRVEGWRSKILDALGENAQVIIDVIPEVEMMIGAQPPVPLLDAVENQNRFNRVFQNFSKVFSKKEHPLVIFLDDLQWADFPTLNLMKLMMTNPDFSYLFFIGAYRDNEVNEAHPLTRILSDLDKVNPPSKISLKPLDFTSVNCLISDSLYCDQNKSMLLTKHVYDKTGGNPFFVSMFLKTLYQEDLIKFLLDKRQWFWDLGKIEAMDITDNVIDLMLSRIRKLPEETQYVLSLAACIGNIFNLKTLSLIHESSALDTLEKFWIAVKQGLIMPMEVEYKWVEYAETEHQNAGFRFLHDRVQQAAYALIQPDNLPVLHLKIGWLFLDSMGEDELDDKIFEVVNHLNIGRRLITDIQEMERLAQLNLRAACKAKLSSAYEPALNYITIGIECLPKDSWSLNYDLTLEYYLQKGETEYLNSSWDKSIATFNEALTKVKTVLDRCSINEYKSTLYRMKNDLRTSLDIGVKALGELGIHIKAFPSEAEVSDEIERINKLIKDKDMASFFNLPELESREKLSAMKLLRECFAPAYFLGSRLISIIGIRMTEITINHGNSPHSAVGYIFFSAITLAADLNDFDNAYSFGKLALRLNDEKYWAPQ